MTAQMEHSYWHVLHNRRLVMLLVGDMMSQVGDGMVIVALPLLTLQIRGRVNPAIAIALIEAAPFTLAIAVSLVFGLGRRRFRPRALLATDCLLRCAVFTGLAGLATADLLPLWLLGVTLFTGSGLRLLASSSRRLVATGFVDERGRFAVNGLLGTSNSLTAYVIGPVLGGVLATAVSPGFVLLLDGLSFVVFLILVLIAVPPGTAEVSDATTDALSGQSCAASR